MSAKISDAAIRVSAHCLFCKQDVETDGSNRCPSCGAETRADSRGQRRIVSLAAIDDGPDVHEKGGGSPGLVVASKSAPGAAQERYVIPPSGHARRWDAARRQLLDDLTRQETAALARYEAAKAEIQRLRRARAAIARDCELIVLDDGPIGSSSIRSSVAMAGRPRKSTGRGVWPCKTGRGFVERCKGCGTTDRPPFAACRCEPCFRAFKTQNQGGTDGN
jgi:hypothetical protein